MFVKDLNDADNAQGDIYACSGKQLLPVEDRRSHLKMMDPSMD